MDSSKPDTLIPSALPHSPVTSLVLVVLVWASFVVMAAAFVGLRSASLAEAHFHQRAGAYFEQLNHRVQSTEAVLEGFAALFSAIGSVDPDQARAYGKQILQRYPHIHALQITSAVPKSQMAQFVAMQRKQVSADFQVRRYSYESKRWQALPDKEIYYPVVFQEPMPAVAPGILGLDLGSVPFHDNAVNEAGKRNEIVASHPFLLMEGPLAYVTFHPFRHYARYRGQSDALAIPFSVQLVVNAAKVAETDVFRTKPSYQVTVYHRDFSKADRNGWIHSIPGEPGGALEALIFPQFSFEKAITVPGGPFTLLVKQQMGWKDLNQDALFLLLSFTALSLAAITWLLYKHRHAQKLKTAHEALLWHHASHDYLTGLSNRRHFMQQLERSKACAERRHDKFGLLFLDLNGFKKINDTYGHETGDQLLKTVAARILSAIRAGDLAARFGGDEFVVLVEGVNSREALNTVAEKVWLKVAGVAEIDHHSVMISASVGSALFPDDGESMHALFETADKAMYDDKQRSV